MNRNHGQEEQITSPSEKEPPCLSTALHTALTPLHRNAAHRATFLLCTCHHKFHRPLLFDQHTPPWHPRGGPGCSSTALVTGSFRGSGALVETTQASAGGTSGRPGLKERMPSEKLEGKHLHMQGHWAALEVAQEVLQECPCPTEATQWATHCKSMLGKLFKSHTKPTEVLHSSEAIQTLGAHPFTVQPLFNKSVISDASLISAIATTVSTLPFPNSFTLSLGSAEELSQCLVHSVFIEALQLCTPSTQN